MIVGLLVNQSSEFGYDENNKGEDRLLVVFPSALFSFPNREFVNILWSKAMLGYKNNPQHIDSHHYG